MDRGVNVSAANIVNNAHNCTDGRGFPCAQEIEPAKANVDRCANNDAKC